MGSDATEILDIAVREYEHEPFTADDLMDYQSTYSLDDTYGHLKELQERGLVTRTDDAHPWKKWVLTEDGRTYFGGDDGE